MEKIEIECNCCFGKVVSLTVFKSSFLLLVTFHFDIRLGRHDCLTFASMLFAKLKFSRHVSGNINNMN